MAGSEMMRMEALTVAISMPSVVLVRTDHLYGIRRPVPGSVVGGLVPELGMHPPTVISQASCQSAPYRYLVTVSPATLLFGGRRLGHLTVGRPDGKGEQ